MKVSAVAGVAYLAAWVVSLSLGAPNPGVADTGRQVVIAFESRGGAALLQFALSEGVAAVALLAVVIPVSRTAVLHGHAHAGRSAKALALSVAAISWTQLVLGIWLVTALTPNHRSDAAGAVYDAMTRADGVKMFLLAAMGLAVCRVARRMRILSGWLPTMAGPLALALAASGLGYLFLVPGLAAAVYVSGILLLVFVAGTGLTLRPDDEPATSAPTVGESR